MSISKYKLQPMRMTL